MSFETKVVGKSVRRVDALEKVQGRTLYTVDYALPHMLHGRFLRSPFARAKILHIDTTGARRVPGVRAIVCGRDLPYTFGSTIQDRPFFAQGQVRYAGEPVAGVAALGPEAAEEGGL
jgi:CO/xanthine dehydrogenase Mo-binding subunit